MNPAISTIRPQRASPVKLRAALEAAHAMASAGILFVPVPIVSDEQATDLHKQAMTALEQLEAAATAAEGADA
ncbi:DUF1382 family protein [Sphaerotilus natans]|uniref:DUF1382 family protein n=1 Tax=Sphaerotilus natans TaxID=34103 RepID=UPI00055C0595